MSITNYWPIINGSYTDYVGGMSLTTVSGVASVADRWNNSNSSFQTVNSSYAQAPAGIYFPGTSFSVMMWIKIPATQSYSSVWDFGNGQNANNIFFSSNPAATWYELALFSGATETDVMVHSTYLVDPFGRDLQHH
jgi:hypothetical protein